LLLQILSKLEMVKAPISPLWLVKCECKFHFYLSSILGIGLKFHWWKICFIASKNLKIITEASRELFKV
jgi:hypothetical protein